MEGLIDCTSMYTVFFDQYDGTLKHQDHILVLVFYYKIYRGYLLFSQLLSDAGDVCFPPDLSAHSDGVKGERKVENDFL